MVNVFIATGDHSRDSFELYFELEPRRLIERVNVEYAMLSAFTTEKKTGLTTLFQIVSNRYK